MKQNRAEKKDKNDCQTMEALLDNKHFQKKISQIKQHFFYKKAAIKARWKAMFRFLQGKK